MVFWHLTTRMWYLFLLLPKELVRRVKHGQRCSPVSASVGGFEGLILSCWISMNEWISCHLRLWDVEICMKSQFRSDFFQTVTFDKTAFFCLVHLIHSKSHASTQAVRWWMVMHSHYYKFLGLSKVGSKVQFSKSGQTKMDQGFNISKTPTIWVKCLRISRSNGGGIVTPLETLWGIQVPWSNGGECGACS